MKIKSTTDWYYAIPATIFLAVMLAYVSCYCDLDVICGFILFSFICNSFTLLANKYLLTYLYNICL